MHMLCRNTCWQISRVLSFRVVENFVFKDACYISSLGLYKGAGIRFNLLLHRMPFALTELPSVGNTAHLFEFEGDPRCTTPFSTSLERNLIRECGVEDLHLSVHGGLESRRPARDYGRGVGNPGKRVERLGWWSWSYKACQGDGHDWPMDPSRRGRAGCEDDGMHVLAQEPEIFVGVP